MRGAVRRLTLVALLLAAAYAPTRVGSAQAYAGELLPRPTQVLVREFAVSPGQVSLDRGISSRLLQAMSGVPQSTAEAESGQRVAATLADQLVAELQRNGLPAQRVERSAPLPPGTALLDGQILSVDGGNRTRRNLIGMGAGRSSVEADAQLYYVSPTAGQQLLESLEAAAQSPRKPGAAETMGASAAAGAAARGAAVAAGSSAGSEAFGASVEADAGRMARDIVARLKPYFVSQGWLAQP
jgi:hypothetical protein